jgi:hypothetical protein
MKDYLISAELLGAIINSLRKVSGNAGDILKCLLSIERVVAEAKEKEAK